MNRIAIEKIEFKNYRQYKDGKLSFPNKGQHMLHVLIAKNGTGKTTLLNAITWCLYEQEKHLRGTGETLSILNADVLRNARTGETCEVSVTVTISADNKMIEFKRLQNFSIRKDDNDINIAVNGNENSEFSAAITILGGTTNTDIKKGEEADAIVKQYFDKDICEFYFFDGEKLGEFFEEGKSDDIRRSILNISQVTLLSNCISRTDSVINTIRRGISKDIPDMGTLLDKKQRLDDALYTANENIETAKAIKSEEEKKISDCDKKMRDLGPVKGLQDERQEKENQFNNLAKEHVELADQKRSFICRYLTLLNLYPRIKKVYDYISEQRNEDNFPPSIDINWLQDLLETESNCPICNNHLTKESRRHIQEYIDQTKFSTKAAIYLREITGELERLIAEAEKFPDAKNKIEKKLDENEKAIEACKARLTDIGNLLRGYDLSEDALSKKIRETEDKRQEAIRRRNTQLTTIGSLKASIDDYKKVLEETEAQIRVTEETTAVNYDAQKQIELFRTLRDAAIKVRENIMAGMREEIEVTTWKYFDSMIWKERTFGGIKIGDDYAISVFSQDGTAMTGSLSATEEMALAYSYTLAIHEASGRNCPLVIDSPLGRVSDDNREKMGRSLLEVSNGKQIIMLFTPAEYSEAVEKMYKGNALVRVLKLSDDENYVEGMEK